MVKESLELLEGFKVLAVDAKKVFADGKIDIADLPVAWDLLSQLSVISAAVDGIDKIPSEVTALSAEEINSLVTKVLEIVAIIKAA